MPNPKPMGIDRSIIQIPMSVTIDLHPDEIGSISVPQNFNRENPVPHIATGITTDAMDNLLVFCLYMIC